ncbi:unnamed protein product [Sphagnum troendelagicum]|uniref:Haloacid dehalogenase-like hydrolase domain-containing protein n=1 Tax=Sphagnum troendelagicum TaxID=128251 RepID=A0ABP0U7M7_9BRYO
MLLCGTVLRTLVQSSASSAMASSSGSIAATAVAAAAPAAVVAVSHQQQQHHHQHQQRTLRGVVFDMDGTLTVPTIDFASMYRRVLGDDHPRIVSGSPIDILHEIAEWSPEKQVQAYAIIAEYEKQALERLQIMPGAHEVCKLLDSKEIRRGLITRNVKESVDLFHSRFELQEFSPALSREFKPYKPSAAPLLHICNTWGASPSEVLMVGDSAKDDIVCGTRAGAMTCLLDENDRYEVSQLPEEQRPDFKVRTLFEINSLLESCFRLEPLF